MRSLPRSFRVLAWGCNPTLRGPFYVGERTLAVLAANQRKLGFERVAIDFNHATLPGSDAYVAGKPPPVFGYGRPEVLRGKGLFLTDVEWTPLGADHARNFEDLSPAFAPKAPRSEVAFLHSVALTPNGAALGLHAPWFSPKLHGLRLAAAQYQRVFDEAYCWRVSL